MPSSHPRRSNWCFNSNGPRPSSLHELDSWEVEAGNENSGLDPTVQRRLLEALTRGDHAGLVAEPDDSPKAGHLEGLTPRETDVLVLVAEGLSNGEIADRLFVSDSTVKTHVNHLLAKTGMRDRAQLVGYAFRHRLVTG